MQDLLGAYPSISAWLADLATDACFELARSGQEPKKYPQLNAVNRFLEAAAGARMKYPKRMSNLDERFLALHVPRMGLQRLEGELFDLLPEGNRTLQDVGLRNLYDTKVAEAARKLHSAAMVLYKMNREHSEKLQDHLDTFGL